MYFDTNVQNHAYNPVNPTFPKCGRILHFGIEQREIRITSRSFSRSKSIPSSHRIWESGAQEVPSFASCSWRKRIVKTSYPSLSRLRVLSDLLLPCIESLRLRLDTHVVIDEEDASLALILQNRRMNIPWINISPKSLTNRNCSWWGWWGAGKFSSLWFCFGLWSACKILRIQFYRTFFELIFGNLCFIVVQMHHKVVCNMGNSDTRVRFSIHRPNSDLYSIFTVQITGCNFHYGPILVFPWIHPFGCDAPSPGRVDSRQATA